jgi:CheY-like chemotaxis protein
VSAPPDPESGLRVLLVEDEIMVALLVETMLTELGHRVVGPIARLDQGLDAAQGEMLDVAVLDVNINGGEAYPIADVLSARGIPFVFVTGYGQGGLRPGYGHCRTVAKPYLSKDLQAAIEAVRGGSG